MQEDIKFILNLIQEQGFQAYVVGGYVRDFYLLNVHNKDIDISTNCDSDKLLSIFSAFNPTMLKYETIKFKFGQFNVDIAQFRDEQYDGTKTIVKLANSLEIDAKRRDFTINSLYMDADGKLIDFYNGLEDLNNHKLRFVGDTFIKIKEDPSRIYRYIYFLIKYNLSVDENDFDILVKYANHFLNSYNDVNVINRYKSKLSKLIINDSYKELIDRLGIGKFL